MKPSRRYRPTGLDGLVLENRLALSGASASLVMTRRQIRAANNHSAAPTSSTALVDQAFTAFRAHYNPVRQAYFDAVSKDTATAGDQAAFKRTTEEMVNLLSQQVTGALLRLPKPDSRGHRTDSPLPLIVQRINGAVDAKNAAPRQRTPTLKASLTDSIPDIAATDTTITFARLGQDNAIEASRIATLNGVSIAGRGRFGNGKGH